MVNEQDRIEEVAFLRAQGKKITAIAEMLQMAQATVDNLLKKAEGQGLYRETVHFDYEKLSPERIAQIRLLDYVEHLRARLRACGTDPQEPKKQVFQQVHVFDSGSVDDTPRGMDARLTRLGFEAARCLSAFVYHSKELGLAWGTTLSSVIKGLDSVQMQDVLGQRVVRFIPTCGEPYGTASFGGSSSLLAAELDRRVNRQAGSALSLSGIPVVIPKEFADSGEDKIIRRFIEHSPNYREIFGSAGNSGKGLVNKLDTILTSVGASEWHWRMCGIELCEIGGIDRGEFEQIVLGDLGGVLLPRSEYPKPEEDRRLREIAELWTGIKREHYHAVARKGGPHRGVVVFAIGANKARIVYRAIRAGLVNHLVCDQALAYALCRECGAPGPKEVPIRR
jgi:DNA-binding transcriptional regulator LsrR (DeoR family)